MEMESESLSRQEKTMEPYIIMEANVFKDNSQTEIDTGV